MGKSQRPLNQQVLVITGASSGIGLAVADVAARKGARLVLASRSQRTLEGVAQKINAAGGEAVYVVADVATRADVERIATTAIAQFGRIDTWINNAGLSIYGRLDEVREEDSRRLFDVNFWGVVNGSLVALPHLKMSKGTLINIGSEVSDAVLPLQGMYAASKHAVKGFTDALRVEVQEVDKLPVTITLIQPTAVNTPFPQHAKNYMTAEPKLPEPQLDPNVVAEAIVRAAEFPSRDVRVGMLARLNTAAAKLTSTLSEKMFAVHAHTQQHDLAPIDPEGTLYKPGEAGTKRGQISRQDHRQAH